MKDVGVWKKELRERVLQGIDYGKELTDTEVEDLIDEVIVVFLLLHLRTAELCGGVVKTYLDIILSAGVGEKAHDIALAVHPRGICNAVFRVL